MATTGTTGTTGTTAGGPLGTESSLSNWVGPYATNLLGKAEALGELPYQTYQGPLTAWESPLQTQAFQQAGNLSVPGAISSASGTLGGIASTLQNQPAYRGGSFDNAYQKGADYDPTKFGTQMFGAAQAQQYMNPFIQTALNPALEEARRQADIARLSDAARLTKAGAYGGSRQAIMESEGRRNLMDKQNQMLSQGYMNAYDKAQQAFTQDQARDLEAQRASEQSKQFGFGQSMAGRELAARYGLEAQRAAEQSRQFGATQGLNALQAATSAAQAQGNLGIAQNAANISNLDALMRAGATQRGIESEGVAADLAEFNRQRDYPMDMLKFQQSMLQGMPLESRSYAYEQPTNLQQTFGTMSGLLELYNKMFGEKK